MQFKVIRKFFEQIGGTFACLEPLKIVHRDLKPENILIQYNKNGDQIEKFVLCDFSAGKFS